jgi:hypothetical protein
LRYPQSHQPCWQGWLPAPHPMCEAPPQFSSFLKLRADPHTLSPPREPSLKPFHFCLFLCSNPYSLPISLSSYKCTNTHCIWHCSPELDICHASDTIPYLRLLRTPVRMLKVIATRERVRSLRRKIRDRSRVREGLGKVSSVAGYVHQGKCTNKFGSESSLTRTPRW